MQTAEFYMIFNIAGSTLPMRGVTPAEYACLRWQHQNNAQKHIIAQGTFKITGMKQVVLSRDSEGKPDKLGPFPSSVELARLRARYKKQCVNALYPGENPTLPVKFSEVGVNEETGEALAQKGAAVEVVENGEVIEVPVPGGKVPLAPASDNLPVAPGANAPTHLSIASGGMAGDGTDGA